MSRRKTGRPRAPTPTAWAPYDSRAAAQGKKPTYMAMMLLEDVMRWLGIRNRSELARLLGVSHTELSHLRTGRRGLSRVMVVRIGKALGKRS